MDQANKTDTKSGPNSDTGSLTYRQAGVDVDAGNEFVKRIKPLVQRTRRPELLGGIGGFGALIEIPQGYRQPVLVAGADGVGTKLKIAIETGLHNSIGIDLVAMCANDVLVQGAEPLFFLDYLATAKLDLEVAVSVIEGIARGCELAGAALAGGETAEMPGMYRDKDYDLAGFCVGVVEKEHIIDGSNVGSGDLLIGLASSGLHSNGFSLVRAVLDAKSIKLNTGFAGGTLAEQLLIPTRIYVAALKKLFPLVKVKAISHITGGGLPDNLPRVLPDRLTAEIDTTSWEIPEIFRWLQTQGNISQKELYRTFNCGVGMVLVVASADQDKTLDCLRQAGEHPWVLGRIIEADDQPGVLFS